MTLLCVNKLYEIKKWANRQFDDWKMINDFLVPFFFNPHVGIPKKDHFNYHKEDQKMPSKTDDPYENTDTQQTTSTIFLSLKTTPPQNTITIIQHWNPIQQENIPAVILNPWQKQQQQPPATSGPFPKTGVYFFLHGLCLVWSFEGHRPQWTVACDGGTTQIFAIREGSCFGGAEPGSFLLIREPTAEQHPLRAVSMIT